MSASDLPPVPAMVLAAWGTDDPHADINADQLVDGADLAIALANWTP